MHGIAEGLGELEHGITIRLNNIIVKVKLCLETQILGIFWGREFLCCSGV